MAVEVHRSSKVFGRPILKHFVLKKKKTVVFVEGTAGFCPRVLSIGAEGYTGRAASSGILGVFSSHEANATLAYTSINDRAAANHRYAFAITVPQWLQVRSASYTMNSLMTTGN
jgi:hypothetical protein